MPHRVSEQPPRFSASSIPADAEPGEKELIGFLERALAPSFTLVRRLGAGGMGSVYLARDPVLKRHVAVKVMSPSLAADEASRARFEREAQAVASISHPNVVAVYSVGELENNVPYLVMQYVEGRTMAERLQADGPLEARTAKRVIGEVASALVAAHRKGIVHRDIKPANILWDEDTGRALVTDFGIAAVREREDERDATRITHTGTAVGTPAYMSPEQLLAEPVTEKTDIYSLGLLGYELLIGDGPYQISSPRELMAAHLRDKPRRISSMRADVDPELERLLEACLIKDPLKRPPAAEVERRLMHGTSVLLEWPPPGLESFAGRLRTALRILLLGAFGAAIPVVAISVFDRESLVRQSMPPALFMLVLTSLGMLLFGIGLIWLGLLIADAVRAMRTGYGWVTMLETMADARGDTGALIAGGREYAELLPAARNALRRNRVIALALRIAAGMTPILGYLTGAAIAASTARGPAFVLWSSLLLSLTLLVAARAIAWQENRVLAPARRRLRVATAHPGRPDRLAPIWTAAFEQIRGGQSLGAGSIRAGRTIAIATGILVVGAAVAAAFVLTVQTLTTTVSIAGASTVPRFGDTRVRIERIRRLASYRVPTDSAISALRAGQALHAISRDGPGGALQKWEKVPAITIPPQTRTPMTRDPFAAEGGWPDAAFRRARNGFSRAERDFLISMADNSALSEFRLLARAPELDVAGAVWDIKPGAEPSWLDLPIPKYALLRRAANANAAQAALDLADGKPRDAEQRLRENISVGFLMINDGRVLLENLIGANIVWGTRASLVAFFDALGRTKDARYASPEVDPLISGAEDDAAPRPAIEDVNRSIRRTILDTTELTGLRWEMLLGSFSFEPCSDMHQIIFGADSLHRATLAQAKASLAKRGSDSLLFLLAEREAQSGYVPDAATGPWSAHRPVARLMTALTGNRQLEGCLALLGLR
jgi:serine/threonine protein kinase